MFTGLCTSAIGGDGQWSFNYELYSDADCEGVQINDALNGIVCYDAKDLLTKAFPNQSVEDLAAGLNINHVVCTMDTARKDWKFTVCQLAPHTGDTQMGLTRYDCGCEALVNVCKCGEGGVGPGELEPGCEFDKDTCDIVCASAPPDTFQCDDTMYILTGNPSSLNILDPKTLTLQPIATYTELLNALGARAQDGFLYVARSPS